MSKFRILFSLLAVVIIVTALSTSASGATAAWIPPGFKDIKGEIDNQVKTEEAKAGLVNDPQVCGRVQAIYDRLKNQGHTTPWPEINGLFVVNDNTKNAGSSVSLLFVNKGMIDFVQSDDELAFVLSHEIGHIVCGHIELNYLDYSTQCISAQMIFGKDAGSVMKILDFIRPGLTKDQEYEADAAGYDLAVAAGYDGKKIMEFVKRMSPGNNPKGLVAWLSSHPGMDKRIEMLEKHAQMMETAKIAFSKILVVDATPFLPLFDKKPIAGWTSISFNRYLYYIAIKGDQPIRNNKDKVYLPAGVDEVYFIFRNPNPANWMKVNLATSVGGHRIASTVCPAMAIKIPAEYLTDGVKAYFYSEYGTSPDVTKNSFEKNEMYLKNQLLTFARAK